MKRANNESQTLSINKIIYYSGILYFIHSHLLLKISIIKYTSSF
jgi:hypothetical protein